MSKERGRIIRCALALSSELEAKRAGLDLGEVMAILAEVRGSCCRRTAYRWIAEFTDLGAYEWKHGLLRKRRTCGERTREIRSREVWTGKGAPLGIRRRA